MEKKKVFESTKRLTLLSVALCVLCASILVVAAASLIPEKMGDGKSAETIAPSVSDAGEGAEVIIPQPVDEATDDIPHETFVPEYRDDEPFVDMEATYDFSKQYDYSYAGMYAANGECTSLDGSFTCETSSAIYAHMSSYAPFPYGTISADVMNNGSDSGLIFGLSTNKSSFWEGGGVSYYFAFVSYEGVLFLGRTVNGEWSTLTYTDIVGYDKTTTYNLKVLYRIDKVILFLNDVPMLSYRTDTPLTGTGWGIRMGTAGAQISNIKVSNKVTLD